MTNLSVNINKFATLRNARGGNIPEVCQAAVDCQRFGADGITIHPRPDERHIKKIDVYELKNKITTEFNIEGYPSRKFIDMVKEIKPTQVTLVPDPPDILTSNAGWDCKKHQSLLQEIVQEFQAENIRVSIFIDANLANIEASLVTKTDRIELYTEPFAKQFCVDPHNAVAPFVKAAIKANELGIGLNAGHDLNLKNLYFFNKNVPFLKEVSIGHALICDAIYLGLENTIQLYKRALK